MDVTPVIWIATIAGFLLLITADLVFVSGRGEMSTRRAGIWAGVYVALSVAFGIVLYVVRSDVAVEFFAGYLTEYSLSVDNLFVFYVIMARFSVPAPVTAWVLMIGIVFALVLRGIFIALGAAVIARFEGVFFIFGAFLVFTAIRLLRKRDEDDGDNVLVRTLRKVVPTTAEYEGRKLVTVRDGRRMATPMLLVILVIGATDLLFALDSLPAVFGLTRDPYIVFVVNAFALLGLRQLYFLLSGLVDRLRYLKYGLAAILLFIGVKLILEAAHAVFSESIPTVSTLLSLCVIAGILIVTTVASLARRGAGPG